MIKLLSRRPRNWSQCVELARLKFEKYFNHKVCAYCKTFRKKSKLGSFNYYDIHLIELKCLLFLFGTFSEMNKLTENK